VKLVRRARRQAKRARQAPDTDDASAYLELAREIHAEVARIAADPTARSDSLVELIEAIPRKERMKLAQRIFDALPPERQWAVLEQVYDDTELRDYLESERAARAAEARTASDERAVAERARTEKRVDTSSIPAGQLLTLGLFSRRDVSAALGRGHVSSTCARRLVLRSTGDGTFQVIEDVFNPNGGYFVTAEYSEDTWRTGDRLDLHAIVRVGSITDREAAPEFEPALYPGGRVDFEAGGRQVPGRLQLGFVMLGSVDVFVS
jgi:hypothetical protein